MFDGIREWIISIVAVVMFMTVAEILLPNKTMRKYAKLAMGLIVIIVIMKPILNLSNNEFQIERYIENFNQGYIDDLNSGPSKNVTQQFTDQTISVFKRDYQKKIENEIEDKLKLSYEVMEFEIDEKNTSDRFCQVEKIVLKKVPSKSKVQAVKPIVIGGKEKSIRSAEDQKVTDFLVKSFGISKNTISYLE